MHPSILQLRQQRSLKTMRRLGLSLSAVSVFPKKLFSLAVAILYKTMPTLHF